MLYFTVTANDVECIKLPDVALTITVVVPVGVPMLFFDMLPQPTAAPSKPATMAMRTHFGAPAMRCLALVTKSRSNKTNAASAIPKGHRRDVGTVPPIFVASYVPVEAVEIVSCVVAEAPESITVVGENEHVAPPGRPEHANDTVPLKPFDGVTVTFVDTD